MSDSLEQELAFLSEGIKNLQGPKAGYAYASFYEYVLAKGHRIESKAPRPEQKRYITEVLRAEGGRYQIKECFSNSQRVACKDREQRLAYYEGYATSGIMPVLHGWLVLDGEVLVDLTWRRWKRTEKPVKGDIFRTRMIGTIPDGYAYFGTEIANRDSIVEQTVRTGSWRCFLDNWEDGYPLLKVQEARKESGHALLSG